MTPNQKSAIIKFSSAVEELRDAGVVRSHRYLGDLAEFLCADALDITLSDNLREVGHDGIRYGVKVQVKYGGGKKTNIDLGDPTSYEEIYIVLGKESVVRSRGQKGDFLVYKLTSAEVKGMQTPNGKYSCGSSVLSRKADLAIFLSDLNLPNSTVEGTLCDEATLRPSLPL